MDRFLFLDNGGVVIMDASTYNEKNSISISIYIKKKK